VRAAVDPVTRSNEKVAAVTATVGQALGRASTALDEGQQATRALTNSLAAQVDRLTALWSDYEKRFAKVDAHLTSLPWKPRSNRSCSLSEPIKSTRDWRAPSISWHNLFKISKKAPANFAKRYRYHLTKPQNVVL